jgi:hypothetical protein
MPATAALEIAYCPALAGPAEQFLPLFGATKDSEHRKYTIVGSAQFSK